DQRLGGQPHHERLDVVLALRAGNVAVPYRAASGFGYEPLLDVAERLVYVPRQTGSRGGAELFGIDVAHDRVGDLAAAPVGRRPVQRRQVGGVRGVLGQRDDGLLGGRV